MKGMYRSIGLAVLALLATQTAFAQGGRQAPPAVTTLSGDVMADWEGQMELIVIASMIDMKATAKADVVNALRQSYEYGAKVIKEFNDAQLVERVTPPRFMGPSASRVRVIYGIMQHTNDIYGQMVVYLRLNGIVPPASRRGGV